MTAEYLNPIVKSWLKGTDVEPPEPKQAAREVMALLPEVRQRHRWWPLPSFQRATAPAAGIPSTDFQPTPIPATNGHAPTATARTLPMFSASKFVVAGAIVALFGGVLLITLPFEQQGESAPGAATGGPGTFSPAGSLAQDRTSHTATLLPDGRVLIVGGESDPDSRLASAEVWDPATESFGPAGSMASGRTGHTATLLPGERVLVIDGRRAEVWDPATESFGPAGRLADNHQDGHTATLLADGRVLVIGGYPGSVPAEVWDPTTASFSPAGTLVTLHRGGRFDGQPVARSGHTATLLHDGRVLVVGGSLGPRGGGGFVGPLTAEVWDPQTTSFEPAGSLAQVRGRTAMLLPDGRVLIVGGDDNQPVSGEVWDPATESFSPVAGSLTPARDGYTATLLPDGRVLVVGGDVGGDYALASAEVWVPSDG